MSNGELRSQASNRLWEMAPVITGAVISLFGTMLVTHIQTSRQQSQFILEKRIDAIREYSVATNTSIASIRQKLRHAKVLIDKQINELSQPLGSSAELNAEFERTMGEFDREVSASQNSIPAHRTLVYALYRDSPPPDLTVEIPSREQEQAIADETSKAFAGARSTAERRVIAREALVKYRSLLTSYDGRLVVAINQINADILKLVDRTCEGC